VTQRATRAVLWDMDGVIADTGPLHYRAWLAALDRRGVTITEAEFRESFGRRNDAIIRGFLGAAVTDAEISAVSDDKEAAYREIAAVEVTAAAGVGELLSGLQAAGYRQALASAAPRANIDLVLRVLGFTDYFSALVDGSEVSEGKPHPEVFLLAAARLGVQPENSLVIEDAVYGVQAARRAGACVIAVTTSHAEAEFDAADLVTHSLLSVSVADIDRILSDNGS
jgi:HAD superfamily hydrolase (TIGR01509 family)